MELTVSIKEHSNIAAFLNVIKKLDYIEIVDVRGDIGDLPLEHRRLLEKRLKKIERGKTAFKSWDLIKQEYENKAV